jgi:cholesterol transport system auxiliary component
VSVRRLVACGVGVLCAALTGGCSGFLQSKAGPEQIYYLRAPSADSGQPPGNAQPAGSAPGVGGDAAAASATHEEVAGRAADGPNRRVGASLRVGHTRAGPGLDSSHIMLVQADHRMNFFAGSRWPGPTADIVEALAVETLRGSGEWSSVEDSRSPFPSDYLLQVAVRRFEADYTASGTTPEVHVALDCILGRREGRDVLATFVASGTARAAANRLSDVVAAFEQAVGTALTALSQQAAQAVRAARGAAQNAERPAPSISRASQ